MERVISSCQFKQKGTEMKNLMGLLVFITLFSNSTFAQMPIKWGFNLGLTSSNQSFHNMITNTSRENNSRSGIECGVFAEFPALSNLSLVGEISYIQKGTKNDGIVVTRRLDNAAGYEDMGFLNERFDYVSASTFAKGRYELGVITPYLFVGPRLNYLAGGNEQVDLKSEGYRKFVFGYAVGVGIEIELSLSFSVAMEAVYDQDITRAFDDVTGYMKNHSIGFLLGVRF
jgi:opacity protein-like surface antigen